MNTQARRHMLCRRRFVCVCIKSKQVKRRDFVWVRAHAVLFECLCVIAHLPALAAVCTSGPVFSRAEEEAAEWWHCLPTGSIAMKVWCRWGGGVYAVIGWWMALRQQVGHAAWFGEDVSMTPGNFRSPIGVVLSCYLFILLLELCTY